MASRCGCSVFYGQSGGAPVTFGWHARVVDTRDFDDRSCAHVPVGESFLSLSLMWYLVGAAANVRGSWRELVETRIDRSDGDLGSGRSKI